jgi:hypothetical protein
MYFRISSQRFLIDRAIDVVVITSCKMHRTPVEPTETGVQPGTMDAANLLLQNAGIVSLKHNTQYKYRKPGCLMYRFLSVQDSRNIGQESSQGHQLS